MTPQSHITSAEQLLDMAADNSQDWDAARYLTSALVAIGHALVAIAVELGAPHATTPAVGDGSVK